MALTNGYQSAFTVAIVFAALGVVVAGLLLGRRTRQPELATTSAAAEVA